MFEQLVRPFVSRQIGTTRRIVPVKVDDTPDEARVTWGSTGQLPQGVVQPKATNLENIESVGWNLRGNIDNFHQTSRESEQVAVPINDNAGTQIGTVTLDRAKAITLDKKGDPYLQQFGYNQNYRPDRKAFSYEAGVKPKRQDMTTSSFTPVSQSGAAPDGLRSTVPSANVSQRTDTYIYP